ncbi:MAG TPA: hypothetical protein GX714_14640 [Chloroflexi bacterium]|nr:hypothetical protein [Chloroflexota bacterium]
MTNAPPTAPAISLLWPGVAPGEAPGRPVAHIDAAALTDLGIADLVRGVPRRHASTITNILSSPPLDAETIAYRQEIAADLLATPSLVAALQALLPRLVDLGRLNAPEWRDQTPLHQVIWRLGQLELLVDCVTALGEALGNPNLTLRSRGLRSLGDYIRTLAAEPTFTHLMAELPRLRAEAERIGSVTIGVNLDHLLRPVAATILSVNAHRFAGESLLGRLLGRRDAGQDSERGIGPLHTVPDRVPGLTDRPQPLLHPLFRDLNDILASTARTIANALGQYSRLQGGFLADLEPELAFYLNGVRLVERLQAAGFATCQPQLVPANERLTRIIGLYNPLLALRCLEGAPGHAECSQEIVANDADLDGQGRIAILTGPNRGGKTTYTQAIGLAHVMAQSGWPVPATAATLSPVDGIYTHFPVAERLDLEAGRLGEEAGRLAAIFARATRRSLVLLNESLASTSPGESLYLARDVVRALRLLGARAVYATHLHELAANLEAINAEVPSDSPVISIVARAEPLPEGQGDGVRPTFRIAPGPPRGTSYARQIASHYGISYDKLAATLTRRATEPRGEEAASHDQGAG